MTTTPTTPTHTPVNMEMQRQAIREAVERLECLMISAPNADRLALAAGRAALFAAMSVTHQRSIDCFASALKHSQAMLDYCPQAAARVAMYEGSNY